MKNLFLGALMILGASLHAQAAELSPGNIIGRYKVSADVGFQKVYLKFHVVDTNEFELQRVHPNGQEDEICNGTYAMNTSLVWNIDTLATEKVFKGVFTCPSNRSKRVDFNINFKNRTTEDLTKGTTVVVTSSLAPGYAINAFVKRQ